MAEAFSESRKQPSHSEDKKARQRMLREKQVVEIIERAHAAFEEKFNGLATMDAEAGGLLSTQGAGRWADDVQAAKDETNWFPDWSECAELRDGTFRHKFIKGED